MRGLPEELLISLGLAAGLIVAHLVGLFSLIRLTRAHIEHFRTPWLSLDRLLVPLTLGGGLFLLHGVEVWAYAVVYRLVGATRTWETALYLSAGAYSTAGWPNLQVPDGWRVTAALESLAGMLLVGWSTAFLFQTLHRILATEQSHPLPEGAIAAEPEDQAAEGEDAGSRSPRPSGSGKGEPVGTN